MSVKKRGLEITDNNLETDFKKARLDVNKNIKSLQSILNDVILTAEEDIEVSKGVTEASELIKKCTAGLKQQLITSIENARVQQQKREATNLAGMEQEENIEVDRQLQEFNYYFKPLLDGTKTLTHGERARLLTEIINTTMNVIAEHEVNQENMKEMQQNPNYIKVIRERWALIMQQLGIFISEKGPQYAKQGISVAAATFIALQYLPEDIKQTLSYGEGWALLGPILKLTVKAHPYVKNILSSSSAVIAIRYFLLNIGGVNIDPALRALGSGAIDFTQGVGRFTVEGATTVFNVLGQASDFILGKIGEFITDDISNITIESENSQISVATSESVKELLGDLNEVPILPAVQVAPPSEETSNSRRIGSEIGDEQVNNSQMSDINFEMGGKKIRKRKSKSSKSRKVNSRKTKKLRKHSKKGGKLQSRSRKFRYSRK